MPDYHSDHPPRVSERLQSDRYLRPSPARGGSLCRVLVVDDEPLMRLFVVRALRGAGYDTIEAENAERAWEILENEGESVSLLLTDVQLPGMSGPELVERAHHSFPRLPTQLMSGRAWHSLVDERLIERDADLLQKPFRIADLLGRLERLLAA